MGYDFNLPSTKYLKNAHIRVSDVVWLDYCCTPNQPFVIKDLRLCTSNWVFATFSLRGCKWKSQIKYIARRCRKLLPPNDDTGIYLDLDDSNEPIKNCKGI